MGERMMTLVEAISVFGETEVTFSSYYKYTFTFTGMFGGKKLSFSVGGHSEDVYRFEVSDQPLAAERLMSRFFDEQVKVHETDVSITLWSSI